MSLLPEPGTINDTFQRITHEWEGAERDDVFHEWEKSDKNDKKKNYYCGCINFNIYHMLSCHIN